MHNLKQISSGLPTTSSFWLINTSVIANMKVDKLGAMVDIILWHIIKTNQQLLCPIVM